MTIGLDSYLKALIRTKIRIDSASRVFLGEDQLEVHHIAGTRKIQLPNTQFLITLDDLVEHGATLIGGRTPKSFALSGAEARWASQREVRESTGLPSNVYIANARSRQYAEEHNRVPPPVRYIGRRQDKMTEVFDTIEEVVTAMNRGDWRKTFRRGRFSRRET